MACFNPWLSETLTRKHWSKSRKQLIRSRSKAKSFWNPESLSASYQKPKSGLGRSYRRRRQSPSHAKLVPLARKSNKVKYDRKSLKNRDLRVVAWLGATGWNPRASSSLQFGSRPVMGWRWCFRTGGRNGPKRILRRKEAARFETAFRGENSWQVNTTVDK
jgi:hypothetical protein